jgi:hypothetical protein
MAFHCRRLLIGQLPSFGSGCINVMRYRGNRQMSPEGSSGTGPIHRWHLTLNGPFLGGDHASFPKFGRGWAHSSRFERSREALLIMTESDSSKQQFMKRTIFFLFRKPSQKTTGDQFSRVQVYLCHFVEGGYETEQKLVSHSKSCLSGISLAVQARGCPEAIWCTTYWQRNPEGPSNPVLSPRGGVGRCLVLVLSEAEREREIGCRLPAAAGRLLLIFVPLPGLRRLK